MNMENEVDKRKITKWTLNEDEVLIDAVNSSRSQSKFNKNGRLSHVGSINWKDDVVPRFLKHGFQARGKNACEARWKLLFARCWLCVGANTEEELSNWRNILEGNKDEVLVSYGEVDIRRGGINKGGDEGMNCLRDDHLVNDEVLDVYFKMMVERSKKNEKFCNLQTVKNSFFYTKLTEAGYKYQAVKSWTRHNAVLDTDKILVPINVNNTHWVLACINIRDKRFEFYDSMNGSPQSYFKNLRLWLADEWKERKEETLDLSEWTDYTAPNCPQQGPNMNCGVFVMKFADALSRDVDLNKQHEPDWQQHMSLFRRRIANELVTNSMSEADRSASPPLAGKKKSGKKESGKKAEDGEDSDGRRTRPLKFIATLAVRTSINAILTKLGKDTCQADVSKAMKDAFTETQIIELAQILQNVRAKGTEDEKQARESVMTKLEEEEEVVPSIAFGITEEGLAITFNEVFNKASAPRPLESLQNVPAGGDSEGPTPPERDVDVDVAVADDGGDDDVAAHVDVAVADGGDDAVAAHVANTDGDGGACDEKGIAKRRVEVRKTAAEAAHNYYRSKAKRPRVGPYSNLAECTTRSRKTPEILEEESCIDVFVESLMGPVHSDRGPHDMSMFRVIRLLRCVSKVLAGRVDDRIRKGFNAVASEGSPLYWEEQIMGHCAKHAVAMALEGNIDLKEFRAVMNEHNSQLPAEDHRNTDAGVIQSYVNKGLTRT